MCCNLTPDGGISSNTILLISTIGNIVGLVVVPIIIKCIERRSQIKQLQSELYSKRRLELIEEYVEYTRLAIDGRTQYYQSFPTRNLILLYVGKSLHHYIDDIDKCIEDKDFDTANELLSKLCRKLNVFD